MFDIGWDELLFTAVIAIIVVGPKDLPRALRTVGRWIAKVRSVSNHFRAGLDAMIREAEMEEMEKKWQDQNRKVMDEHPGIEMTAANGGGAEMVPLPPPPPEPEPAPQPAPSVRKKPAAKPKAPAKKPAAKPKPKATRTPKPKGGA